MVRAPLAAQPSPVSAEERVQRSQLQATSASEMSRQPQVNVEPLLKDAAGSLTKPMLSAPTYTPNRQRRSLAPDNLSSLQMAARNSSLMNNASGLSMLETPDAIPASMQPPVAMQEPRGRSPSLTRAAAREALLPSMPPQAAQPPRRGSSPLPSNPMPVPSLPSTVTNGIAASTTSVVTQDSGVPPMVSAYQTVPTTVGAPPTASGPDLASLRRIADSAPYPQSFTQVELGSFAEGLEQWQPPQSMESSNSFQARTEAAFLPQKQSVDSSKVPYNGFQPPPKGKPQCPVQ